MDETDRTSPTNRSPIRVLVVDDEKPFRDLLVRKLTRVGNQVHGVGEFGVETPGRTPAEVVGDTVLSLRYPSFLRTAIEARRPHVGPLEPTHVNLKLVKRLGGILPRQAVAVPLIARGTVRLVLYGDNGSEGAPVGPLDVLEGAASRASRILERTIAARERKERGPGV